jgi:hypothetical protein
MKQNCRLYSPEKIQSTFATSFDKIPELLNHPFACCCCILTHLTDELSTLFKGQVTVTKKIGAKERRIVSYHPPLLIRRVRRILSLEFHPDPPLRFVALLWCHIGMELVLKSSSSSSQTADSRQDINVFKRN